MSTISEPLLSENTNTLADDITTNADEFNQDNTDQFQSSDNFTNKEKDKNGKTVYTFGSKGKNFQIPEISSDATSADTPASSPKKVKKKREWIGGSFQVADSNAKYKFEDAMATNLLLDRILLIDKGIMSLALMSLGLSILEYNLEFNYKPEDKSNT